MSLTLAAGIVLGLFLSARARAIGRFIDGIAAVNVYVEDRNDYDLPEWMK